MKSEALFYKKIGNSRVECFLCPHFCKINPGKIGLCGVRQNLEGKLYSLIYGEISSSHVDPIEKKPLAHFFSRTLCFSVGTLGCNFHCIHCQNWEISFASPVKETPEDTTIRNTQYITPLELIELTIKNKCQGIAWTYNEPTIWFEYTLDCAKLAKEKGLYTVYVTNGYINLEALDTIGPYLDAYRVDIKGFTNEFYQKLAKIKNFQPILEAASRAKKKWNMHVEIVTNIIPTLNDDENQLKAIAEWIVNELGRDTVWHITRFHPHLKLSNLSPTPIKTLEDAQKIGFSQGLQYVYIGNVPGHKGENTYCHNCKKLIIERNGYNILQWNLDGKKCKFCGTEIPIRT